VFSSPRSLIGTPIMTPSLARTTEWNDAASALVSPISAMVGVAQTRAVLPIAIQLEIRMTASFTS
jgi:hypothetical protein